MKGFTKDGKFRPTGNKKRSPSKNRKKRQNFEKPKIQSLIFQKKDFSMSQTKEWAVDHGYKAVKVEPTKNTWRIRQFSPNKIKRGTECRTIQFGGSGVQGVLCDTPDRFRHDEPDEGWQGRALSIPQLKRMLDIQNPELSSTNADRAIKQYYIGSATHVHGRSSHPDFPNRCYYCGLHLGAS